MTSATWESDDVHNLVALHDLEQFARRCLRADSYPGDSHPFQTFRCDMCGLVPWALTIEHHTGSVPGDFMGIIRGRCSQCGHWALLFGFTGEHRRPTHQERPNCACGGEHFWVAMCERIEGENGLPGFFDVGVVVGRCATCGRNLALVYTD